MLLVSYDDDKATTRAMVFLQLERIAFYYKPSEVQENRSVLDITGSASEKDVERLVSMGGHVIARY